MCPIDQTTGIPDTTNRRWIETREGADGPALIKTGYPDASMKETIDKFLNSTGTEYMVISYAYSSALPVSVRGLTAIADVKTGKIIQKIDYDSIHIDNGTVSGNLVRFTGAAAVSRKLSTRNYPNLPENFKFIVSKSDLVDILNTIFVRLQPVLKMDKTTFAREMISGLNADLEKNAKKDNTGLGPFWELYRLVFCVTTGHMN
jgi:hypothetical protein